MPIAFGRIAAQTPVSPPRTRDTVNGAVISAAKQLAAAKPAFKTLPFMKFNPQLWQRSKLGVFEVKPGVRPSQALNDIYANPKKYGFECATAIVVVYHKAVLDLIGPKDFDAAFQDLKVGNWKYDDTMKNLLVGASGPKLPGDYGYFKNPGVSWVGWLGGWQGENVISLGNDQYYGHPFGITTGKQIVQHLDEKRWPWSKREAALTSQGTRISLDVFELDRQPG